MLQLGQACLTLLTFPLSAGLRHRQERDLFLPSMMQSYVFRSGSAAGDSYFFRLNDKGLYGICISKEGTKLSLTKILRML